VSDFPNAKEFAAIKVLWKEQRARDWENISIEKMQALGGPICIKPYFDTLGDVIKNLEGMRKKHV